MQVRGGGAGEPDAMGVSRPRWGRAGAGETQPNRTGRGRGRPRTRLLRWPGLRAPDPSLGLSWSRTHPSPGSQLGATRSPLSRRDLQNFPDRAPLPPAGAGVPEGCPLFPGVPQLGASHRAPVLRPASGRALTLGPWTAPGEPWRRPASPSELAGCPPPAAPPLPFLLFPSSERLLAPPVGCWLRFWAGRPGPQDVW